MRLQTLLFAFTLLATSVLGASVAEAQLLDPRITQVAVPTAQLRISRENLDDDGFIELSWSATHPLTTSYEWELTFDNARSETFPDVEILFIEDEMVCDESLDFECRGDSATGFQYTVKVQPSLIVPDEAKTVLGAEGTRPIWIRVYKDGSLNDLEVDSASWEFVYDTQAPAALPITAVAPGDQSFTVAWDASAAPNDVERVDVALCLEAVTSTVGPFTMCSDPKIESGTVENGQVTISDDTVDNLSFYRLAIRSEDDFTNTGEFGAITVAQPVDLVDFYEAYIGAGGTEDGGNCFVATAAHGSYAHPVVRVLRTFRDQVLARSVLGQALVQSYYELSPPVAHVIAQSPTLATTTRLALIPVAILAALVLMLPFLGGFTLLWLFGRRLRRSFGRVGPSIAGALVLLGAAAISNTAAAQMRMESGLDWFGVGIEFKGGPYSPALARNDQTFRTIFADTEALTRVEEGGELGDLNKPLFSLGLEAQLYRGFGTLAVGGSFGFMQWVGRALTPPNPGEPAMRSNSTNVFHLLPLTFTATYRFDWLVENTKIPLVPYVRGGFAYYRWWVGDSRGKTPEVAGMTAKGGVPGLTGTLGISFLMNVLEPRAARSLSDSTGIRGTYLFAEFNANKVDGFSEDGFDFSDATWNIGMFLEL